MPTRKQSVHYDYFSIIVQQDTGRLCRRLEREIDSTDLYIKTDYTIRPTYRLYLTSSRGVIWESILAWVPPSTEKPLLR